MFLPFSGNKGSGTALCSLGDFLLSTYIYKSVESTFLIKLLITQGQDGRSQLMWDGKGVTLCVFPISPVRGWHAERQLVSSSGCGIWAHVRPKPLPGTKEPRAWMPRYLSLACRRQAWHVLLLWRLRIFFFLMNKQKVPIKTNTVSAHVFYPNPITGVHLWITNRSPAKTETRKNSWLCSKLNHEQDLFLREKCQCPSLRLVL